MHKVEMGKISFTAAVLMSINIMVGAGILYAVDPMTASSGGISFLGWPLIGLLLVPVLFGLAKASQLFPGNGGFYHYGSSGIGPLAGFIGHWGYLLGYMGTVASLATVLRNGFVNNLGMEIFSDYPFLFNIPLVLFYTLIHFIDLNKISKIQSLGTLFKLTPLLLVIALFAFYTGAGLELNTAGLGSLGGSASTVLFAFWGFESCCSLGSLLKDGPQKIGLVMLAGFVITMSLYLLFHLGLLFIMGPENLATYGAVAFPSFLGLPTAVGEALTLGMTGAIMFSWANSLLGVSLTNITNIHFLAENNLILGDRFMAALNKNNRPTYAAIAHGAMVLAFITFISNVDILFALTSLGVITAFTITLLSVFATQIRQKIWGGLPMTVLGFASCSALFYYSWMQIPSVLYTLPLILGMTAGIIIFKLKTSSQEEVPAVAMAEEAAS
jgi:amino acid transporter